METDTLSEQSSYGIVSLRTFLLLLRRYRALLLVTVGVFALIAVAVYLVLPVFGVTPLREPPNYRAQMDIRFNSYPVEVRRLIDFDLSLWISQEFLSTSRVRDAYQRTIGLPAGIARSEADTWIETTIMPALRALRDVRTGVMVVTFTSRRRESLYEFLETLASDVRDAASTRVNGILERNQADLASAEDELLRELAQELEFQTADLARAVNEAVITQPDLALQYLRLAVQEVAIVMALESSDLPWSIDPPVTVVERPDDSLFADPGSGAVLLMLIGIVFAILLTIVVDYVRFLRATWTKNG